MFSTLHSPSWLPLALGGTAAALVLIFALENESRRRRDTTRIEKCPAIPASGRHQATGLLNFASQCYINAVFQAIAGTFKYVDAFKSDSENAEGNCVVFGQHETLRQDLCAKLQHLVHVLNTGQTTKTASAVADTVLRAYRLCGGQLQGGEQDAHEFFVRLMDFLDDTRTQINPPPLLRAAQTIYGTDAYREVSAGFTSAMSRDGKDRSPPADTRGFLSSTVVCPQCRTCTTVRVVSTACITVSIPAVPTANMRRRPSGIVSVQECLDAFFEPETIEGFRCDTCKAVVDGCFKVTTLTQPPALLVVHVNRLQWPNFKNDAKVLNNDVIDINRYVCVAGDRADQLCMEKYRLVAVIVHMGNSTGGHYVCYRRNPAVEMHDTEVTGGAWLRISDSNVAEVPFSAVMTAQPYMVFYEAFVPRKLSDLVADDVTRFLSK
eukprot:m.215294 g.215294  ORF g.215294 m.215294 type:complete len:435 (+) comp19091_c0_seq2:158-1462(+)